MSRAEVKLEPYQTKILRLFATYSEMDARDLKAALGKPHWAADATVTGTCSVLERMGFLERVKSPVPTWRINEAGKVRAPQQNPYRARKKSPSAPLAPRSPYR
nr:hypothetical protein DBT41_09575 [Aerococcus urinae]